MEPLRERVPRRQLRELLRRARHRLHLARVDRLEQRLPLREVAVERADADPGPLGDVLERGGGAFLGEGVAGCGDEGVVVPAGIGAHRAPGLHLALGLAHSI